MREAEGRVKRLVDECISCGKSPVYRHDLHSTDVSVVLPFVEQIAQVGLANLSHAVVINLIDCVFVYL